MGEPKLVSIGGEWAILKRSMRRRSVYCLNSSDASFSNLRHSRQTAAGTREV